MLLPPCCLPTCTPATLLPPQTTALSTTAAAPLWPCVPGLCCALLPRPLDLHCGLPTTPTMPRLCRDLGAGPNPYPPPALPPKFHPAPTNATLLLLRCGMQTLPPLPVPVSGCLLPRLWGPLLPPPLVLLPPHLPLPVSLLVSPPPHPVASPLPYTLPSFCHTKCLPSTPSHAAMTWLSPYMHSCHLAVPPPHIPFTSAVTAPLLPCAPISILLHCPAPWTCTMGQDTMPYKPLPGGWSHPFSPLHTPQCPLNSTHQYRCHTAAIQGCHAAPGPWSLPPLPVPVLLFAHSPGFGEPCSIPRWSHPPTEPYHLDATSWGPAVPLPSPSP